MYNDRENDLQTPNSACILRDYKLKRFISYQLAYGFYRIYINVLRAYGIGDEATKFLHSYLTDRKIESKEWRLMEFFLTGYLCIVVFHKAVSWDHSCLTYSLTI